MPVTVLSFPLDATRWYLLGQIEYYFSVQNLAQDLFLRKQMDSRGWISIPLIASFNRVKQLTLDAEIVRDVLRLSSLVEVHVGGDHVRLKNQWSQFVLPDAPSSSVNDMSQPDELGEDTTYGEDADEDDEEDDVVFVLGRDAGRSWTPDQRFSNQATPNANH
ncbi:winged helix DNA-binding domain-containing protein [Rickenella mellea]|uniref:Winged helix DNA-binding domain-containing protein n=1 Tax=Rickenella mellea TaxID=50990 RepID=A0A4Y7QAW1_9AGAM|nr:winged helix DNA-binding domain-containing protein [Rickenella mellea]